MIGCGLRRQELAQLKFDEIVEREGAPDGARVITGSSDGVIKFGGLDGHDYGTAFTNAKPILDVAWSQDCKKLLALTGAGELKIWQIRQVDPMEEARTLVSKANDLMKAGGPAQKRCDYMTLQ